MRSTWMLCAVVVTVTSAPGCSRPAEPPPPAPAPAIAPLLPPPAQPTAQAAPVQPAQPAPAVPPAAPAPSAPTGPRDNETASNYVLAAALAPATAPADTTFTLELHGAGGYHVNEQYPIQVDLETQNATAGKTTLRRADAAEYVQAGARFVVPVHTTGAGATVRGRARFAVCSAENCVPETRQFAVALP